MTHPARLSRWMMMLAAAMVVLAAVGVVWVLQEEDASERTDIADTTSGDGTTSSDTPAPSEHVPAFVVAARVEGGTTILSVDYIQFLTGDAAVVAAAERGDEFPPPNDYYIVNDDPRIRELIVRDDISVTTVVWDDGTSDPGGHALPLADWVAQLDGPSGSIFKANFYWLTIIDDTILTIEQQYLP